MECIKDFQIDKNIIYLKKNSKKKFKFWQKIFCCPFSPILKLFENNFCSRALIEKNYISSKLIIFSIFKKEFQKISGPKFSP